ncbi:MAG: hypothetical protein ACT4PN_00525, partial [Nitrospiraceae bacterium]
MRHLRAWNHGPGVLSARLVLGAVVLLTGHFVFPIHPGSLPPAYGADGYYSGKQGHIVVVKVPTDDAVAQLQGKFLGRSIRFFPDPRLEEPKGFVGLLGIDLQDEPGSHELTVEALPDSETCDVTLQIVPRRSVRGFPARPAGRCRATPQIPSALPVVD